ncbi:MAG: ATP-dependent RNA helicase DbpA [Desulfobulbaceae bacterium]|uniref:ATP-dependent RNA helicase DbpA n=1 Tax=Candidatus Desulfobia pelagia TaxID=2841692 RepID=A0A8J6NE10_9BACT|nr:ATP-dependent RNA helicase DbpA [Candidatus Desulfobia pelagia]
MTEFQFSCLPISKAMIHNLNELGFKAMTPVQAESLPHILKNCDVIAQAKTGSGKTAAFGIGVLHKLDVKKFRVQSLILCPTRELADQVAKELRRLARATHNVKILTLCGGVAFGPQYGSLLHGAHIIVGTPGRVLQHLDKGYLSVKDVNTLVLDEADRMLDMGFIDQIDRIVAHVPQKRQTLLFSATYPEKIIDLSSTIQKNAINIEISGERANKITEYFYGVAHEDKLSLLIKIIAHHKPKNVLIFCNTKLQSQDVADHLFDAGIGTLAIHGDLEQYERTDVLVRFANNSCSVLVATDVAARGLDIKELEMVVNYDIPQDEATYIHRIGRTGRAGREGIAITLFNKNQAAVMEKYRNETRKFDDVDALIEDEDFILVPPNVTLVLEGGKKDKMRPGDILGALTGEAGIEGKYVGKIDIYDRQSYVAVERSMFQKAFSYLKNGKIKGRTFSVWVLGKSYSDHVD